MGEQGRALATRFEETNREAIWTVEKCSDAQWRTKRKEEFYGKG